MASSSEKIKHPLELDEDYRLHLLGWKIQRIGWGLMALFFILGAIGLFGSGLVSMRTVHNNDIILEYERFERFEANTKMVIRFPSEVLSTVSIPHAYLDKVKLEQVFPEPQEVKMEKANYTMIFSELKEGRITLFLLPQITGSVQTTIYINQYPFSIDHFIYP